MAGVNADKSIYKHLMDVMARVDELKAELTEEKQACKEEIQNLKQEHRKEIAKLNAKHQAEMAELKAELREVKEENWLLKEENRLLKEDKARRESNDHNNSSNSSLPPSTDQRPSKPKSANKYNSRTKSGRKSGGQKGHPGKAVKLEEIKRLLEEKGIHPEIKEFGNPGSVWKERLVLDLPIGVKASLLRFYADETGHVAIPKEYENEVSYGKGLKSFAVYLYGQGVQSLQRTTEMIAGLTNDIVRLSEGTVNNWLKRFHNAAESVKKVIENRLLDHHRVNTDGTVVTMDGRQSYIRNFSTKEWVLYVPMGSKGHKSLSQIPFLQQFAGILVHDHETSLYRYGIGHAECNVHLLRYLRKNTEDTQHCWSSKLAALLTEMNNYVKRLKASGSKRIPEVTLERLEHRYDEILEMAINERKEHRCRYNWASSEEKTLLNRLKKYKAQHLLFLHDFAIPFDNNMSERDLRKCKNRQKMSGGFRTEHGKDIFCSIISVIETCKRQSMDVFASIKMVFAHQPLFT